MPYISYALTQVTKLVQGTDALMLNYGAALQVIEKHFTTNNELPGRDNKFALNPVEFKKMVANIRIAEEALINHGIDASPLEGDTIEHYRGRWGD